MTVNMTVNNQMPDSAESIKRRARQFRIAAILVLLLGLGSAGMIYWMGTRPTDLSDEPSMLGYDRASNRQMGILYGNTGALIMEWSNDLKQPNTQAFLIVMATALVAGGCFYVARSLDSGTKHAEDTSLHPG